MGTSWKQAGIRATAAKRGAIVSKLAKEIAIAAKVGDPNPANNARLRTAVEAARKNSVPKDVIERAIKKGAGLLEGITYELVTYEGFAPNKVPVIVECMTDNKNRTAADIRVIFRKGQIGASGSVAWMFDRMGAIEASHPDTSVDIEGAAIEAGAQNVEKLDDFVDEDGKTHQQALFTTEVTDLDMVGKALTDAGWKTSVMEIRYFPKNKVELTPEQEKETSEFLETLDDHDDVHRVFPAL